MIFFEKEEFFNSKIQSLDMFDPQFTVSVCVRTFISQVRSSKMILLNRCEVELLMKKVHEISTKVADLIFKVIYLN